MKKVYTAENPAEAHLVAGLLDEEGIECVVEGDVITGFRGVVAMDASTLPTVLVRDEDAVRAAALIAERHVPRSASPSSDDGDEADEAPAPVSAGMVFFKRLLLALIVLTISAVFWVPTRDREWSLAILGVIVVVSFGIAWLVVPGRRAPR